MAKPIYNEKIRRETDWGGDATTGGAPVSGARVQEYIKSEIVELERKATALDGNVTDLGNDKADKAMFAVMSDTQYEALTVKDNDVFYYIYED